jgi:importin subunit alpha-1
VTGDDKQTQMVLDFDVLSIYNTLLFNPRKSTIKETCWAISNITAGNTTQIQVKCEYEGFKTCFLLLFSTFDHFSHSKAVIDANLFPKLFNVSQNADHAIKKELGWIIANAMSGSTLDQMKAMIEQKVLQTISLLLDRSDSKLSEQLLESIERMVKVFKESGWDSKEVIKILEDSHGSVSSRKLS